MKNSKHTAEAPRVLAVASGGGHWIQLLRLRPAFRDCEVSFATVKTGYRDDLAPQDSFFLIADANLSQKLKLIRCAFSVFVLICKVRPQIVVSTGAAPGFFAIFFAKLMGRKTVWVDSIANAEELSISGGKVGPVADLWLTQWNHLSKEEGPGYAGQVF